jgi:hypothetical protein
MSIASTSKQIKCVLVPHSTSKPCIQVHRVISDLLNDYETVLLSPQQEISDRRVDIYASFRPNGKTNMYLADSTETKNHIQGYTIVWMEDMNHDPIDYLLDDFIQHFQI